MKITCGVPQGSILGPLLFLIYFNDFENCLKNSRTLSFADDTVVYVEGKTKELIELQLNDDLNRISSYFRLNQLVINLKRGKTEAMLFGTSKRLSNGDKKLSLMYDNKKIETTETYKYLGTTLDTSLSLATNFDKIYKRAMAKLRVMSSLRNYLDNSTKSKIFRCMILPCITYNCTVNLSLNQTQKKKLNSIDKLAARVTGSIQPLVGNEIMIRSIMLVRKCIDNKTCGTFNQYFVLQNHGRGTRNDGFKLKIPQTKLKYSRSGFFSMGVSVYNKLPLEIRKIENFKLFRTNVFNHFYNP